MHVWREKRTGGELWRHLRQAGKQRRKRYGAYDSRGRLAGKRSISERPAEVEARRELGHWEIDTVMGTEHGRNSVVTLVERATGYTVLGKLARHCAADATACCIALIERHRGRVLTITADNGTEFHSYAEIEAATGATFYFATPHHSWERGTNENTNGLLRQYLPKRTSLAHVTQTDCDAIAAKLNSRPRKRLGYKTRRSAMRKTGRRERPRRKRCTTNLNSHRVTFSSCQSEPLTHSYSSWAGLTPEKALPSCFRAGSSASAAATLAAWSASRSSSQKPCGRGIGSESEPASPKRPRKNSSMSSFSMKAYRSTWGNEAMCAPSLRTWALFAPSRT